MIRSGEHDLWDAYMATAPTAAWQDYCRRYPLQAATDLMTLSFQQVAGSMRQLCEATRPAIEKWERFLVEAQEIMEADDV